MCFYRSPLPRFHELMNGIFRWWASLICALPKFVVSFCGVPVLVLLFVVYHEVLRLQVAYGLVLTKHGPKISCQQFCFFHVYGVRYRREDAIVAKDTWELFRIRFCGYSICMGCRQRWEVHIKSWSTWNGVCFCPCASLYFV